MTKTTIKLILWIIIVAIFLPFILNFIFGYIIPLLPGIMYVGTNETWVNFIGGFLGASVTLIGVHWQLERNKTSVNKELISNTKAVYILLEKELNDLKFFINEIICLLDNSQNFIPRHLKENKDLSYNFKNNYIGRKVKELIPSAIQTDIIYNFIGKSVPVQKVILIRVIQNYLILMKKYKQLELIPNDLENQTVNRYIKIAKNIEKNIKEDQIEINKLINELKNNKNKFQNFYSHL